MTTVSQAEALEALRLSLALLALWCLYFVAFKNYQIDAFRQRLFNLRGELFDYALDHGLPFTHPAYGLLRTRMNRLIRYGHHFNAVHMVLILLFFRNPPAPGPHQQWNAEVDRIADPEMRATLRDFESRMAVIMVKRVALSPIALPCLALFALGYLVKGAAEFTIKNVSAAVPGLERMEAQAEIEEQYLAA